MTKYASFELFPFVEKCNEALVLELATSTPSSKLGIGTDMLSLLPLGFLLVQNPFFCFYSLVLSDRFRFPASFFLWSALRRRYLDVILALASHLFVTRHAVG